MKNYKVLKALKTLLYLIIIVVFFGGCQDSGTKEVSDNIKGVWYGEDGVTILELNDNNNAVMKILDNSKEFIWDVGIDSENAYIVSFIYPLYDEKKPLCTAKITSDYSKLVMDNGDGSNFTYTRTETIVSNNIENESEALIVTEDETLETTTLENYSYEQNNNKEIIDTEDEKIIDTKNEEIDIDNFNSDESAKDDTENINYLKNVRETLPRNTISSDHSWGHTVAVKTNGVILSDNKDVYNTFYTDWENNIAVAAGGYHISGLLSNGKVATICVSDDIDMLDTSNWDNIVDIAAGRVHTIGLKSDGTVIAAGRNSDGQCNVSDWTDIIAISAGEYHTAGVKSDGTVVAVGQNTKGQCDVYDWENIVDVSVGSGYTVGLKANGTVITSGSNIEGRCNVSDWEDIVAVSAGFKHTVGLKADGTVVAVGKNNAGQCDVSDWEDIVAVSAGLDYTVGIKSDGTLIAVGYDCDEEYGRFYYWENIKTK